MALLALAVPLPALALSGDEPDEGTPAVTSIAVSSSLDSCGTAAATIVCKIDASWSPVAGATRYTASVTRADGSVVDYGEVGAGSQSFWVPYVGNGTYTVTVSAYGTPPGEVKASIVARDSSSAGSKAGPGDPAPDAPGPAAGELDAGDAGEVPEPGPGPEPEEPSCEEPVEPPAPTEPPVTEEPVAPGDGAGGASALSAEAESALSDSAVLPESVDCPDDAPAEVERADGAGTAAG